MMKLVFTKKREPSFENFGATIENGVLVLPEKLARACGRGVLRSAEQILSKLHTWPTSFSHELGWTIDQVGRAREGLVTMLEGRVSENFLRPPPPRRVAFGAMPPPGAPAQPGHVVTKEEAGTAVYDLVDGE